MALMSRLVGDAVINLLAYKSSGSASSPWQPREPEMKSDMKSLTEESRTRSRENKMHFLSLVASP